MYRHNLTFLLTLTKTFLRNNPHYTILWLFMRYALRRLKRLSSNKVLIQSVPDEVFAELLRRFSGDKNDYECCALGKLENTQSDNSPSSHWVCSKISRKKYKIFIRPFDNCENGKIFVSETTRQNMIKALGQEPEERSYFVMMANEKDSFIAAEARISMITNAHDCSSDLIDCLLKAYFMLPRYARRGDIFAIDVKKYAPEFFYSSASRGPGKVHFRVEALGVRYGDAIKSTREAYILRGETSLTQLANISSYVPPEYGEIVKLHSKMPVHLQIELSQLANCPPFLEKPLAALSACISPFLDKDVRIKIKPIFLIKGAPGSGKFRVIQCLAKRNGMNLLNVDFSEIQCSSAAQTEAKLRIVLQNARARVPCILRLGNIQIFGKNSEGKKDERIVSTFASELEKMYVKKLGHPIIVIATLENDEIEVDTERLFIETILIEHPDKSERISTLSWFLHSKGLRHQANLTTIAGMITDFGPTDIEALIMQTAKIAYQKLSVEKNEIRVTLTDEDFFEACELMQASFSDRVSAPRIPKVYWEDIGGLASLKHEIKRRIELPMSNTLGLGKSGLLLHGPPGTGKTLLAKAVATECQLHFMSVKGPELLNMYVGQSEKNIRQVFERARASAPCVIFFDELDSLAPNRGQSGDSGGVMDRVVSQLLAEMDGLESSESTFIIAATNRLDLIDPALLRPGRFDKMLYVGIYDDPDSQLSVLRAVTRRFRMKEKDQDLSSIVDELPKNLTGADLYAICSDSWLLAVRRTILRLDDIIDQQIRDEFLTDIRDNGIIVELEDFVVAAQNLVPSLNDAELARYEKLGAEFSFTR